MTYIFFTSDFPQLFFHSRFFTAAFRNPQPNQIGPKLVIEELDGGHFAILADESSDVYQNEQLVVCLHYVDEKGRAVVRFLGLAHVEDTTSLTLKAAI